MQFSIGILSNMAERARVELARLTLVRFQDGFRCQSDNLSVVGYPASLGRLSLPRGALVGNRTQTSTFAGLHRIRWTTRTVRDNYIHNQNSYKSSEQSCSFLKHNQKCFRDVYKPY